MLQGAHHPRSLCSLGVYQYLLSFPQVNLVRTVGHLFYTEGAFALEHGTLQVRHDHTRFARQTADSRKLGPSCSP